MKGNIMKHTGFIRLFRGAAFGCAATLLLAGCTEEPISYGAGQEPDGEALETVSGTLRSSKSLRDRIPVRLVEGYEDDVADQVYYRLNTATSQSVSVTVSPDLSLVNTYNDANQTSLQPLPAGNVSIGSGTLTVAAGKTESDPLEVVFSAKKSEDVHVTAVAGVFPHSQSFLEVKLLECRMAVEAGADEIDVVLALNAFLDGDYERASAELRAIRAEIDKAASAKGKAVILKVILETGLLVSPENIAAASFLAMEAGADFIKTSTGKTDVSATPMAAYIMCGCIAAYYRATGRKVGFKPAGGMVSSKDAASYYFIVSAVLGKEWLNKGLFRFGVSRMANNLLTDLEQSRVAYF